MDLKPTNYIAEYNGYNYNFHSYKDQWSCTRYEVGKANIPPNQQILTNDGWIPCLGSRHVGQVTMAFDEVIHAVSYITGKTPITSKKKLREDLIEKCKTLSMSQQAMFINMYSYGITIGGETITAHAASRQNFIHKYGREKVVEETIRQMEAKKLKRAVEQVNATLINNL